MEIFLVDLRSLPRLVVVLDLLATGRRHHLLTAHGLLLLLHSSHLAKHLVSNHVHHGVDTLIVLLRHHTISQIGGDRLVDRRHGLENVDVLWVLDVVNQVVELHLTYATGLQEV